jgi:exodeoxyribonuclease III
LFSVSIGVPFPFLKFTTGLKNRNQETLVKKGNLMRITTWNVNGIRAALNKGFLAWVESEKPDVLCLQEIKARPEQVPEEQRNIDGYQSLWNPAERPGYSGVSTYFRIDPLEIKAGMDNPEFDNEGRVIHSRYPNFHLFNVYFPNGQRGQDRVDYKLRFYGHLLDICDQLHRQGENVIITGDFNTAHTEIDLANPKENSKYSGFLPEEREWVTRYLDHGLVDVFRQLNPDKVQYTWWTYRMNARQRNIGWRLDYFLVTKGLTPNVKDVKIHDDVMGSDHCPVTLYLDD